MIPATDNDLDVAFFLKNGITIQDKALLKKKKVYYYFYFRF